MCNICGSSVWNLLHITLLANKIFTFSSIFGKFLHLSIIGCNSMGHFHPTPKIKKKKRVLCITRCGMKNRLPNFVLQRFTKLRSSYNCNPITRKLVTSVPSSCVVLITLTSKMRQTLSFQHIQTRCSLIQF